MLSEVGVYSDGVLGDGAGGHSSCPEPCTKSQTHATWLSGSTFNSEPVSKERCC